MLVGKLLFTLFDDFAFLVKDVANLNDVRIFELYELFRCLLA